MLERSALDGMGINHRRSDIAMSKQFLNGANIIICFQQVACERMPEGMSGRPFGYFGAIYRTLNRLLHHRLMDMLTLIFPSVGDQR